MSDHFTVIEARANGTTEHLVPMTLKPAFDAEAERQRNIVIVGRQTRWTVERFLARLKDEWREEVAAVKVIEASQEERT